MFSSGNRGTTFEDAVKVPVGCGFEAPELLLNFIQKTGYRHSLFLSCHVTLVIQKLLADMVDMYKASMFRTCLGRGRR